MYKRLLLVVIIAYGAYASLGQRPLQHAPGVLVSESPRQHNLQHTKAILQNGYRLTPLAEFQLQARVLGRERYRLGREADLAPLDLALGWGPMSDSRVLDQIEISQGGRFYTWSTSTLPIPRRAIERHSANMHMIPADNRIEQRLLALRTGDLVDISGYLVRADAPDGWHWQSSMTRDDTGSGACELIWVNELTLLTSST